MGVKLPGLGALGTHWRTPMATALPEAAGDGLVLDLRSSAYTAAWKPKGEVAGRVATVRVLHAPTRKVVSHFNKATKGRIVRALLEHGGNPRTPGELADLLADLGWKVEVGEPTRKGTQLDVVVDEV
jgi:cytoplasmic iron level regulating protein YaaA (DUF328/UPF0246 family)